MLNSGDPFLGKERVAFVGAGPASLTAAYELQKLSNQHVPHLFEAGRQVGGIARTEIHEGYRFDIGGHRFFTKVPEVEAIWEEVMGDDFITVPRLSRIYYRGRYFDYPLKFFNALKNIGPTEAVRIVASYMWWRARPHPEEETFEQWVVNRFGLRLYNHFFRSYTQKVWGIPPNQIRSDWAAQRIKDLSLLRAVTNALGFASSSTSLIEEFKYPRLGPGMMWERIADQICDKGGSAELDCRAVRLLRQENCVTAVEIERTDARGEVSREVVMADHFVNSAALRDLLPMFDPPPPDSVMKAAARLNYRDFLIVTLILDRPDPFPDNWIYIHDPDVTVGRIQNFRAWSSEMIPNRKHASIGMEYFCNHTDPIWAMDDTALRDMAARELDILGLADKAEVIDSAVIRQHKAYPVYDAEYQAALNTIREWLDQLENFQTIGRNGLHRYNNQDHSMLTGMLAARNIIGEQHDLWSVNVERAYQEEFVVAKGEQLETQLSRTG